MAGSGSARPVEGPPGSPGSAGLHCAITASQLFGDTRYALKALAEDPADPGSFVDIRSELEFPLDTTLLGGRLRWDPAGPWALGAEAAVNVTDPSNKMVDRDWVGAKQLAHTESEARLDLILGAADVCYRVRDGARLALALLLHFEFERIEQHLVGFEGWQGSLFSDQRFPISGTGSVIDYRVTYLTPQLGVRAESRPGRDSWLGGDARVGLLRASDTDDHLRRGRIAEGEGWGVSVGSRLEAGWAHRRLAARIVGDLRYFYAEGTVDQRWYRDGDLPEGTEIRDIPYDFESLQFQIGLDLGLAF